MTATVSNSKQLLAPLYHLELVRDRDVPYDGDVKTTEAAAQVLHNLLDRSPVEQLIIVYLNSGSEIIGCEKAGMGGVEQVNTHPSEVFRGAIVMAAPEILIAHNHMDGMVRPSVPDIMFTMNCLTVGAMLGIRVRDHIVVGPNNKHMSIRENHYDLRSEFAQAERQMFGMGGMGNLTDIKEKLLSILDPSGKGLPYPGAPKKSGDPSANAITDWKQSLSYQYFSSK